MSSGDSIKRLTRAAATTAVMLFVVWQSAPTLMIWHRGYLANQLAAQVATAEDSKVKIPLRQMAQLGEPALEPLVVAAASQRAAVSAIARQILEEKLAVWQVLAKAYPAEANDLGRAPLKLAAALATHIDQFGPAGKQWVEHLTLDMIDLADVLPAQQTGPLLADCSRILVAVPPRGPKLRTVAAVAEPTTTAPGLDAPQPKLETLTRTSEIAWAAQPQSHAESKFEFRSRATSLPPPNFATPAAPKSTWSPTWDTQQAQPVSLPKAAVNDLQVRVSDLPQVQAVQASKVIDVPTPQAMKNRAADLRELSSDELLQRLRDSDFYEAGIIRVILGERGFANGELVLRQRLASPNVADRLRVLEDLSALPAASARRLLHWLLEDQNADVRLKALTAIATTNDPGLADLARELAVSDEDARVSELASRILRQVR